MTLEIRLGAGPKGSAPNHLSLPRNKRPELLRSPLLLAVGEMRIDPENHLLVGMPHPALGGLQVDSGLVEHGEKCVPIMVNAKRNRLVIFFAKYSRLSTPNA